MPTAGIHKIIILRPQSNASTNRRLSGYGKILSLGITVVQDLHHFETILNQHFSADIKSKVTAILPFIEIPNILKFKNFNSYKSVFSFISYSSEPLLPQTSEHKFLNCIWNSNGDPIASTNVLDFLESLAHADDSNFKRSPTSWASISHSKNIKTKDVAPEIQRFLKLFKIERSLDTNHLLDSIVSIAKSCADKSQASLHTCLDGESINLEMMFDHLELSVDEIIRVFNFQSTGFIHLKITEKNKLQLKAKLYLNTQEREPHQLGVTLIQVDDLEDSASTLWVKSA